MPENQLSGWSFCRWNQRKSAGGVSRRYPASDPSVRNEADVEDIDGGCTQATGVGFRARISEVIDAHSKCWWSIRARRRLVQTWRAMASRSLSGTSHRAASVVAQFAVRGGT